MKKTLKKTYFFGLLRKKNGFLPTLSTTVMFHKPTTMFIRISLMHIRMYLCLTITMDPERSALLITIDNVNAVCACVYLKGVHLFVPPVDLAC